MTQMLLRRLVLHWPFPRGRPRLTGLLSRLLLAKPETVADIDRIRFPFLPQHAHYFFGLFEPETQAFFRSTLSEGDVCVDIGANCGYFTAIAADCVGRSGAVHSFEPEAGHFARLQRLADLNPKYRIQVVRAAMAEKRGTAQFFVCDHDGWHSLLRDFPRAKVVDSPEVTTWSLDAYLTEHKLDRPGAVRLAKVDVEGAEGLVVRGAAEAIKQHWVQEFYVETASGPDAAEIFQSFAAAGYAPLRYDWERRQWVPMTGPEEICHMVNIRWVPAKGLESSGSAAR